MKLSGRRIRIIAHRSMAAFMAVWLSGVVFLLCCPSMAAASPKAACPLAAASDHCKRSAKKDSDVVSRQGLAATFCCEFLPAVFDKSRKIERAERVSAAVSKPVSIRRLEVAVVVKSSGFIQYSSPLIDQHEIFLRNRVLRI